MLASFDIIFALQEYNCIAKWSLFAIYIFGLVSLVHDVIRASSF